MHLKSILKIALSNLRANKVRSFLTMLGVIVGVGSVIVIISVGAGAQSLILNQVKGLGTNLVGVLPGKSEKNSPPAAVMGINITTLKLSDAQAITQRVPHVIADTPLVRGFDQLSWQNRNNFYDFLGVSENYPLVQDSEVGIGRFFTQNEADSMAKVLVLGHQVALDLFEGQDPLGQSVKIKNVNFRVIGVMEEKGSAGFENQDLQVFLPITTVQKLLLGINHIAAIRVKIDESKNIQPAITDIETLLRERHKITNPENDDFTVLDSAQALQALLQITDAVRYFLASIAAMALVVGGIGIMNIMLVVVSERIKEIGLRKALGAKRSDILFQFVLETMTITFLGGLIGIFGGIVISGLVALGAHALDYAWDFVVSPNALLLAVFISFLVGLVFGIYPARKAAKLSPMEALKYE
ncbi:MAG: hypothetical protein COU85_02395 [Candidatus Portnoybacteria bacterium CG10_big_fil_rev_8_21_14_0_10_44_7]|uniref:Multidrug ABC transporter substrate-binding protein n=1 Tax=Candidatus Portnoybacteria bacterium CG10_big_fil_rev_8_21_14_0_10_44_7 TaxID=1974816 RepID=A0A2M8KIC5_9BACT|nr:MAG: hypothetical protein COU85_02395 [Candidatus Portnoybacteria bacterium CG10_big_fil_rev_8_21_14_0_10_44_7]